MEAGGDHPRNGCDLEISHSERVSAACGKEQTQTLMKMC